METKNAFKNFLTIYKYLPALISSMDRLVEIRGVGSSNYNNTFLDTTLNQTKSILTLIERKVLLINLKVATNNVLGKLKPEYSKLLILRYIDGFSVKDITEKLKLNPRTYFRRINSALKMFSTKMEVFISQNKGVFYKNEAKKCLDSVFKKLETWNDYAEESNFVSNGKIDTVICNSLFKEMKKTSFCS